jgi:hypothetical protein
MILVQTAIAAFAPGAALILDPQPPPVQLPVPPTSDQS